VRVEQTGFKRVERAEIRVGTSAQVTVDFALELGATSETVTVKDEPPLLNTASADLGATIDKTLLGGVTFTLSRNVLNAVALTPGVVGGGVNNTDNGAGAFSISGGGSTVGRVEMLVDGIPNTTAHNNGGVIYVPSIDDVEEIKVHTTLFDAQYGHSNGGAINVTTKSGTNQLHGTGYLYKRFSSLDANSWANNNAGLPKPPTNFYQAGYQFSGPVTLPKLYRGRNRTFFTTSFERDVNRTVQTRRARVPTLAERAGDFSRTVSRRGGAFTLFDPATTTVAANRATRQLFPNNVIPASRITPTGRAWLGLYPEPNDGATTQLEANNWIATGESIVPQTQLGVRIDHHLSDRQRLFGRFGMNRRFQTNTELIRGAFAIGGSTAGVARENPRRFFNAALDDTITISPSLIASLRYGFLRKFQGFVFGGVGFDTAPLNLAPVITGNQAVAGWPVFSLGENLPTLGSNFSEEINNQHSLQATFTKIAGRHSVKWGLDWRILQWNRNSPGGSASGEFNFDNTFTRSDPFTPTTGDNSGTAMASVLLGLPATGAIGYLGSLSLQNHYLSGFVQEDMKVNQRLTLNFGLRYELETPYTERYNRMSYGFNETARLPVAAAGLDLRGGITFAGEDGLPRRGGKVDGNNFGPRFGFAYNVARNTVLRGGYGMFFSGQAFNTGFLGDVGVFNATTSYVGSIDNGATAFTTLANPFPSGLRQPIGASAGLLAQAGDALTFFDERRVSPYNQQWQFSVQRQLPSQVVVEAAYVGMLSLKQFENFNLNEKPDAFLAQGTAENTRVPNPFLGVLPANSVLGQGATITQNRLWVRFPQYTALNIQGVNSGKAIYHALQLKVDKRMTKGLTAQWNYTFSKLMDNETTSIINPRKYRTVSSLDQTSIMRMAATYELPWAFRKQGFGRVLEQIAGGWSLSGYFVVDSGLPLAITHVNGRPLRTGQAVKSGPVSERLGNQIDPVTRRPLNPYFNTSAFTPLASQFVVSPEPARFDELRAPGVRSLNASLFKTFPLTERVRLQFRIEAQGATNTPNFAAPGTNMSAPATFGVITAASGARRMQASARVIF
jgi:hypothetical protein